MLFASLTIFCASGFRTKLFYRESVSPSLIVTIIASHIHEWKERLQRHSERPEAGKNRLYLGLIDFTHHCCKQSGQTWEEYNEIMENLFMECKEAFNDLKQNHRHLLPTFISQKILDRLSVGLGELCMPICLDKSKTDAQSNN